MAKRFYFRFIVRDEPDDLIFEVDEAESDRLGEKLSASGSDDLNRDFYWFDTTDGRSVIIDLAKVQACRLLWDVAFPNPKLRVVSSNASIEIKLAGRPPLKEDTDDPDTLYGLFRDLEGGDSDWPSFIDDDGEAMHLNAKEVVWVIAPKHVIDEGHQSEVDE